MQRSKSDFRVIHFKQGPIDESESHTCDCMYRNKDKIPIYKGEDWNIYIDLHSSELCVDKKGSSDESWEEFATWEVQYCPECGRKLNNPDISEGDDVIIINPYDENHVRCCRCTPVTHIGPFYDGGDFRIYFDADSKTFNFYTQYPNDWSMWKLITSWRIRHCPECGRRL